MEDADEKVKALFKSLKLQDFRSNAQGKTAAVEDLIAKSPKSSMSELAYIKEHMPAIQALFAELQFKDVDAEKLQQMNFDFIFHKRE